jgi:hypothetical protein
MNSNHNLETMTADERRAEVAGLLARGLLRAIRNARARTSSAGEKVSESGETCLDSSGDLPLSVARRPAR